MLLIDTVTPIFVLFIEIIKLLFSLVKLILYIPAISCLKLILLLKDGIVGIFLLIKGIFMFFKSFVAPMANK